MASRMMGECPEHGPDVPVRGKRAGMSKAYVCDRLVDPGNAVAGRCGQDAHGTHERNTGFIVDGDRYRFDFEICSTAKGYAQVDTAEDAWYHGMWANPDERRIVRYVEGDVTIDTFSGEAEFVAGIRRLADRCRERETWKGVDPGLGDEARERWEQLGLGDLLWPVSLGEMD